MSGGPPYVADMTASSATSIAGIDSHADGLGAEAPFHRIVCGIDGSRMGHEAALQAAALAGRGSLIELIAVADEWGLGLNAAAVLSKAHARHVLDSTARELRHRGLSVETRIVSGHPPFELLMQEAEDRDLLVVGRHSRSRLGGIAIGRTTTNLVHRCTVPLLVATPAPAHAAFPGRILVAADGPGHPERAVRLAGLIARQCGSDITLLRINWSRHAKRPELATAIAELNALGVTPVEVLIGGLPRREIPALAARERSSLIIAGSRGLGGPRALGSVSERIAHDAPCSVLIVRPPLAA